MQTAKKPELAYDLLQYLNSEKGDSILAVEGKHLHARIMTMLNHWKEG